MMIIILHILLCGVSLIQIALGAGCTSKVETMQIRNNPNYVHINQTVPDQPKCATEGMNFIAKITPIYLNHDVMPIVTDYASMECGRYFPDVSVGFISMLLISFINLIVYREAKGFKATFLFINVLFFTNCYASSITHITTGYYHTCAMSTVNPLKCWGYNNLGQLGYGDTNNRGDGGGEMGNALLEVGLGTGFNVTDIVAGYDHTCAMSTVNPLKCWGYNNLGQLGYGDTNNRG
eukprot:452146_1